MYLVLALRGSGIHCLVKGCLQNAHLVPKAVKDWPSLSRLSGFSYRDDTARPQPPINDTANGITLRADLHGCMDDHVLILYPKGARFVAHFLQENLAETACERYHNIPCRLRAGTGIAFVYARFVYCIFARLNSASIPDNLKQAYNASVSQSPKTKRQRPETSSPPQNSKKPATGDMSSGTTDPTDIAQSTAIALDPQYTIGGRTVEDLYPDYFKAQYPALGGFYSLIGGNPPCDIGLTGY